MNNENKTIHEFDINLILEYFSNIERQGPGSPEITIKALSFIDNLTKDSHIADIGCGTGGQTLNIAKNTSGQITAIDLSPTYIDILNANSEKQNLQDRIKGVVGSMKELSFRDEGLDLLWCEGAIYNIGFERGLKEFRKFIKPGGYIAVSEGVWFTNERPSEIYDFWMSVYPEIDTISNKVAQMQNSGYLPVAAFTFPESCWTKYFDTYQVSAQEIFLKKYRGNKTAEELVANQRHEAQLYKKYKEYYGYAFFIGKKI